MRHMEESWREVGGKKMKDVPCDSDYLAAPIS